MSLLHELKPHPGATKRRKRVGRGVGTGLGKTSGRGHKGQKARGPGARPGFEGGQMPIIRTMPKRGFTFKSKERYQILNLSDFSRVKSEDLIDRAWLHKNKFISSLQKPVKILGNGEISKPLKMRLDAYSRCAVKKIEKAGGACDKADKA